MSVLGGSDGRQPAAEHPQGADVCSRMMTYAVALEALFRAAERQVAGSRQQAAEQPQGARDLFFFLVAKEREM